MHHDTSDLEHRSTVVQPSHSNEHSFKNEAVAFCQRPRPLHDTQPSLPTLLAPKRNRTLVSLKHLGGRSKFVLCHHHEPPPCNGHPQRKKSVRLHPWPLAKKANGVILFKVGCSAMKMFAWHHSCSCSARRGRGGLGK
jgi:hypothetical protein